MTKGFSEHFNKSNIGINTERTAIIVVDLMNDFMVPGGKMVLQGGDVIVEPIKQLIKKGREKNMKIIYIKDFHRADKYDKEFDKRTEHCVEGTWGGEIIDELKPEKGDYVIQKRRYSAFFQTDLDLILRELKIESLIVTGVVTNICVRSTIHDAFFLGYNCIVPEQCVMATGEREQASSLWDIDTHFGTVMKLEDVIELIEPTEK